MSLVNQNRLGLPVVPMSEKIEQPERKKIMATKIPATKIPATKIPR